MKYIFKILPTPKGRSKNGKHNIIQKHIFFHCGMLVLGFALVLMLKFVIEYVWGRFDAISEP